MYTSVHQSAAQFRTAQYIAERGESVMETLRFAIEKFPMIERLIVADKDIASAKTKIAHGNNSLSLAFRELSKN